MWTMRIRRLAVALAVLAGLAACESDPMGPVLQVEGTYSGSWTFIAFGPGGSVIASSVCPGSVTIGKQSGRQFAGSYLVTAAGDCDTGSPVSGEVADGLVRGDGGLNFTLVVPNSNQNIFEDFFAGANVIPSLGPAIVGCDIIVADNQMNGSVAAGALSVSASASLVCPEGISGTVFVEQLQIRMAGSR